MMIFVLAFSSIASAGFFNFFFGENMITGQTVGLQEGEDGGGDSGGNGGDSGGGDSGGGGDSSSGDSGGDYGGDSGTDGGYQGDDSGSDDGSYPSDGGYQGDDSGSDDGDSGTDGGDYPSDDGYYDEPDYGDDYYGGETTGSGCNSDSYWDGQSCVLIEGYYDDYGSYDPTQPPEDYPGSGCNPDSYWDVEKNSCVLIEGYYNQDPGCNPDSNWDPEVQQCILIEGYYKDFFKGSENYGGEFCANGECCPDGICDAFEQSTNGCPIDCGGDDYSHGGEFCAEEWMLEEKKAECHSQGGQFEVSGGEDCRQPFCKFSGGGFGGPDQFYPHIEGCESMGLDADVRPGFGVECVPKGSGHIGYVEREIDAVDALEFIIKIDAARLKIDEMRNKISGLADYYEDAGDDETATNYRNSLGLLEDASAGLDKIKEEMKNKAESAGGFKPGDILIFRGMLQEIVDGTLTQVVYAMLGAEVNLGDLDVQGEDCGNDDYCFEEMWRACAAGTTFDPEEGITVSLHGADSEGVCEASVNVDDESISCEFDAATWKFGFPSKEMFMVSCDDRLAEIMFEKGEDYTGGPAGPDYGPPGEGPYGPDEYGPSDGPPDFYDEFEQEFPSEGDFPEDTTGEEVTEDETIEDEPVEEEEPTTEDQVVEESTEEETVEEEVI